MPARKRNAPNPDIRRTSLTQPSQLAALCIGCLAVLSPARTAAAEASGQPDEVPETEAQAPPQSTDRAASTNKLRKRAVGGLGLSTQTLTQGGSNASDESQGGKVVEDQGAGFRFKGVVRGPMRFSIDDSGRLTPGKLQFHAPPVVPDGNFTRWTFTNNNPGPWAELLFQYGTQQVTVTTTIASYNLTAGGWRELQDQQGIDRAFLTLKFPEALGDWGGMAWDAGVFSNFYGAMGKYSGGMYETYLIGRTRIAGATATADINLPNDWQLVLEAGGGAKIDQQYQTYDSGTRTTYYPSWQPFPGSRQIGTTMLLHGHAGLVIDNMWTLTAHYIDTFARDARWNVASQGGTTEPQLTPDASIQVAGIDLKLDGGWRGDGYLGYAYLKAKYADVIGDSIEVIQSQGGWQLAQNYFPDGNGKIHSIGFQYMFSLTSFLTRPMPFYGQGADLVVTPFMMLNKVTGTTGGTYDMTKVKGGLDTLYSFGPKVAAGFRYDRVMPNLSDSSQTFQVLTPRLVFRSRFMASEMITLQYCYYLYNSGYRDPTRTEALMPWPYGQYGNLNIAKYGNGMPPDKHVVNLSAFISW